MQPKHVSVYNIVSSSIGIARALLLFSIWNGHIVQMNSVFLESSS